MGSTHACDLWCGAWGRGRGGWESPRSHKSPCALAAGARVSRAESLLCWESTTVAKLILTRIVALLNAPLFLRKELKEKDASVCRERHSQADMQAATGTWSGGHASAFQRACERAGITKWPFHGITGSADNSVFSQVWFVHKNVSWNLKGQAQLHTCDKVTLDRVTLLFGGNQ